MSDALAKLRAMQAVCPGNFDDGVWRPTPQATSEQIAQAQQLLSAWPLMEARSAAAQRLRAGYAARIAQGVTPQGCAFALRADEAGQQRVARFLTLLRENETLLDSAARASFAAAPVTFDAVDGRLVTLTVSQWRAAMVSYGLQTLAIETTLATLLQQAAIVATQEAAQALQWPATIEGVI